MTIVADLINLAKRDSGVLGTGQTAQRQEITDSLRRLNMMISQWSARRWLVYHLIDTGVACTGALSYTVGPGQTFDIARPDRLEAAYLRQLNPPSSTPVDYPLRLIQSQEEYSRIALKTLAAAPSEAVFYDSGFPTGKLYPWPLPNNQWALHILTKAVLSQFGAVSDDVILPPEYEEAIYANLVIRERAAFRLPPDPTFTRLAKAALKTIRASNFQVAPLRMPVPIRRGPAYNVLSDRGN
jgi:hypothetical protein